MMEAVVGTGSGALTEKIKGTRNSLSDKSKVLGAHGGRYLNVLLRFADLGCNAASEIIPEILVIHRSRVEIGGPSYSDVTTVALRDILPNRLDPLHDLYQHLSRKSTYSSPHCDSTRDYVEGTSSFQLGNAYNSAVEGAQIATYDGLETSDHGGACHNGVRSEVGHGCVATDTMNEDLKAVAGCQNHPALATDDATWKTRPQMKAKGPLNLGLHLQYSLIPHPLSPSASLLSRLEHEPHGTVDVVFYRLEDSSRTEKHAGMSIMSAGVHAAGVGAFELNVGPGTLINR
mmetsp:Transcript_1970/g.3952  ORF Transcript_1970/g.3952 Transcript_1970/m.3952 type:complete len:288 (+) Transcript_1970:168-1031(+)